jgi:CheY-like chemotaxis protein
MEGTDLEKSNTDVHVLVVEDHRDVADFFREVIESLGCTVETIHNGVDVRAAIKQRPPDVMFLDLGLPGMDGIEVLRELGTLNCKSKIFMMSGSDLRTLAAAEELGKQRALSIAGTIPKPIMAEDVEAVLKPLLKSHYPVESLDVREALGRGDFFILFQPKVNLRSESQSAVQGAEALLRWNHPTFGIIPPDRFLGAIRQQALMPEVTGFVMKEAVSACKYWKDQGQELTVGINIDGSQMGDLQLPDFLTN